MSFTALFPVVALVCLASAMLFLALKPRLKIGSRAFVVLSGSFFLFSAYVITKEGALGFWSEHTRNLWGNQIWLDLLLFAASAWFLLMPRASKLKMHLVLWLFVVLGLGSIGLLLMISRILFLEERVQKVSLKE
jgi:hypothetical protein